MTYQIAETPLGNRISFIDDRGVTWFIPKDEANTDYQRYLEWVAKGNEPEVVEL